MTNVEIPIRIRVIAYLVGLCLGAVGLVLSALVAWAWAEGWLDKPTDTMLVAVLAALLGLGGTITGVLALAHLGLPDGPAEPPLREKKA